MWAMSQEALLKGRFPPCARGVTRITSGHVGLRGYDAGKYDYHLTLILTQAATVCTIDFGFGVQGSPKP